MRKQSTEIDPQSNWRRWTILPFAEMIFFIFFAEIQPHIFNKQKSARFQIRFNIHSYTYNKQTVLINEEGEK